MDTEFKGQQGSNIEELNKKKNTRLIKWEEMNDSKANKTGRERKRVVLISFTLLHDLYL